VYVQGVSASSDPRDVALTLSYIKDGTTATDTVKFTVVGVEVGTPPTGSTIYVEVGLALQLDCAGSPSGGTYQWSVSVGGQGTFSPGPDVEDPAFTPDTPGTYVLRAEYTMGGVTVSALSGEIVAVSLEILRPCDTNSNGLIDDPDNEFAFEGDEDGELWLWCQARDCPEPERLRWTIDDVGDLRAEWDPHLEGDPHTGTGLRPTARFTGMPESNADFGPKTVSLGYVGLWVVDQETIEVFFDPLGGNNPGPAPDDIPDTINLDEVVVKTGP
jgi:hypothetical protein